MKIARVVAASALMIVSAFMAATPALACHSQTTTVNDASWTDDDMAPDVIDLNTQGNPAGPSAITVAPGEKAYFNWSHSLGPGCGSIYYLFASLGAVPAGWKATFTSGPDGTGTDYSNVDNVQCGSGNCVIKGYLVVTAPMQCMEGDSATITAMMGIEDNACNDKDLVYAKCKVSIHIPHPSPEIAKLVAPFSIKEDTTDDTTINLTSVFRNVDGDPMLFGVEPNRNIVPSVYQTGRVLLKPKADWNGVETLNFNARDALSGYVVASVIVTVTAVPDPPVLSAPMKDFAIPQDAVDDGSINLNKVFFDADTPYGDVLVFTASGQDKINVTIKADGKVRFQPVLGWSGEEYLNFTATDDTKGSVTDEVKVTVTNNAKPPYVKMPIKETSFPEDTIDESIDLSQNFATPMYGTVLAYDFVPSTHFNVTLTPAGKVTLVPRVYWHGTETITFTASDGMFMPVYADARVTVTHVNHPPFQVKDLNVAFAEDENSPTIYLDQYFADHDGDKLSYSMPSSGELTVTIYQKSAELHISPALNYNGESQLTLKVTDGQADLSIKVPVKVTAVDDLPMILSATPSGNVLKTEGEKVEFSVEAMDIDGEVLGTHWMVDGNYTLLSGFNGKLSAKFTADAKTGCGAGTHSITVFVDGNQRSEVDHTWTLTVRPANRPPAQPAIRSPAADKSYTTDSLLTFDAFSEDPDADVLGWTWFIDGVQASTQQSFSTKLAAGAHTIKVTVTDGKGGSATSAELAITVAKAKPAPTGGKGAPGFEALALVAALGVAMVLLRKRK